MNTHWCADCNHPVSLDTHGRCSDCQSDAVDSMERPNRAHGGPAPDEIRRRQWFAELERDLAELVKVRR